MNAIQIDTPYYKISALQQLATDNTMIIALHGWLDNAASFKFLADYLPQHSITAIDMVGHGHSPHRSPDASYHLMDWVQDLYQVIESLQLQKVVLLGHSLGGIVASIFASCFPEKVKKLVMIEAGGPLTKLESSSHEQIRESILSRDAVEKKVTRSPKDFESVVRARMLAGDFGRQIAYTLMDRNIVREGDTLRWRSDPRLRTISSLRLTDPQAENIIASIECPTQVILGDSGFEKVKLLIDARYKLFKNITLSKVSGGHHCHMEYPESVAGKIVDFLN